MAKETLIEKNACFKKLEEVMISQDKYMVIKALYREGMGKRRIARMLGIDVKTVRKQLRAEEWQGYRRSVKKPGLLDDYKEWLHKRMPEVDYNAKILCRELKLLGYVGSYETVKDYSAPYRKERRQQQKATVRFETGPGKQGQADWGSAMVWLGDKLCKIHFFALVLGFSRRLFAKGYTDEKLTNLLAGHEAAFNWFGGYPSEMLYDNPKTMVTVHDVYSGEVLLNSTFKDFVNYYGYKAKFCQPYRARTKGKIESGVKYIKRNFLAGRRFNSLEHLNAELEKWLLEVADTRVHGTTHQLPIERFQEEQVQLQPMTGIVPYKLEIPIHRKVSSDAMISLDSNRYSVPWHYLGSLVDIFIQGEEVHVYLHGHCIAVHQRLLGKHQQSVDPKHFAGLFKHSPKPNNNPPQHDPYWWSDVTVAIRDLHCYELAAGVANHE